MALLNKAAQSFEKFSPSVQKDSQSRKICETKVFSMKVLPDTNSEILKSLLTFSPKMQKTHGRRPEIFQSYLNHLQKNCSLSQSSSCRKNAVLKTLPIKSTPKVWKLFSQSPKTFLKKKIDGNFFSPKVLWTRGRKSFQPLI